MAHIREINTMVINHVASVHADMLVLNTMVTETTLMRKSIAMLNTVVMEGDGQPSLISRTAKLEEHILVNQEQLNQIKSHVDILRDATRDVTTVVRDGTAGRASLLARMIIVEDSIKTFTEKEIEQKKIVLFNRQLQWALGIAILGNLVSVAWGIAQRLLYK